jgi:iron complex outermembrane recepter protein
LRNRRVSSIAAALPIWLVPLQLIAQTQSELRGAQVAPYESAASPQSVGGLEEITVTATRREEKLSKVSASIAAVSREQLDTQGVRDVQDVVALTPGISFSQNTGFNANDSTVSIRGITSKAGAATTGVYIDDTPIQALADIENFLGDAFPKVFDFDRIEVLRGPQGTLFGGGAEGGVIRFITPKPGLTDYSGYLRSELGATQGGNLSYELGGAVGGPIVPNEVGFRVSVWDRRDGGYTDRVPYTTGQLFRNDDNQDSTVARVALTVAPTDKLTIAPSLFYQRVDSRDQSTYWPSLSDPGNGNFVRGNAIPVPVNDYFYLPTLNVDYDFSRVTARSITSYFYRVGQIAYDLTNVLAGFVAGNWFPTIPDHAYYDLSHAVTKQRTWTQELRLESTDSQNRLKWVAGIFFQHQRQFLGEHGEQPYFAELLDFSNYQPITVAEDFQLQQTAAFANVDYQLANPLTLTLGVRATRSTLNFSNRSDGTLNGGLSTAAGRIQENPITPKAVLSWQATPDALYYGNAAKGYRIGGVNVPAPQDLCGRDLANLGLTQTPPQYSSDHTWSYEIGTKNRLADGRIRYEASAYHITWSGVQLLNLLPCGYPFTANAGSAISNGFDLSLQVKVFDSFVLGLAAGYTDAHYTRTVNSAGAILAQDGAAVGNPSTGNVTPPWITTILAQYSLPVYQQVAPYLSIEYEYHSKNRGPFTSLNPAAASYDPTIASEPATNLVNVRSGAKLQGADVSLYVNNLLNAHPQLGLQHAAPTSPVYSATTFRPRSIGVTVIYRY